jgi:hypothetical protein
LVSLEMPMLLKSVFNGPVGPGLKVMFDGLVSRARSLNDTFTAWPLKRDSDWSIAQPSTRIPIAPAPCEAALASRTCVWDDSPGTRFR